MLDSDTIQMLSSLYLVPAYLLPILSILIFYKRIDPPYLRLFLWYLLFELFFQIGTNYYSIYTKKSNHAIVNLYSIVNVGFFLYLFYRGALAVKLKRTILFMLSFYTIVYILDLFVFGNLSQYSVLLSNLKRLIYVVCGLLYLGELFNKDGVIRYFNIPMFWISTSLILCSVVSFLYFGMYSYILRMNIDSSGMIMVYLILINTYIQFILYSIGILSNSPWKRELSVPKEVV